MNSLAPALMKKALQCLDGKLKHPVRLIVGGGGAMILAHHFPLSTMDIDAIPAQGTTVQELDPLIRKVASELNLPEDWLNPYFATFTHVLPADYASRLIEVFQFEHLQIQALSMEDLLIMKCFAGRQKDVAHVRALVKKGADTDCVQTHLEYLEKEGITGAKKAIQFLEDVIE